MFAKLLECLITAPVGSLDARLFSIPKGNFRISPQNRNRGQLISTQEGVEPEHVKGPEEKLERNGVEETGWHPEPRGPPLLA